jgi:hypothetical protein
MDPATFAGWTAECTGQLPSQSFSQVKSEQWAAINSSACNGFRYSTASNFNATSGGGLTADCLSQFSYTSDGLGGCSGFQAGFVGSINPDAFAGWTAECTKQLPSQAFAQVKSEQWAAMNSTGCNGFRYSTVSNFNSTSGGGMTAACLSQFSYTSDGLGGCSGFQAGFVGSINPDAFAGWTAECTKQLPSQAFSLVYGEQFAKINPVACSGFRYSTASNFGALSGTQLTAACLSQFSYTSDGLGGCSGLQAAFIGNVNPAAFAGWTAECTGQLPSQSFSQVKSEQWAAINSSACNGFRYSTVSNFNVTSGGGLTADCLSQFSYTSDGLGGCSGLQAGFVGEISPQAFSGFKPDCISAAPSMAFSLVTSDQFAAITASSCNGFRYSHAANFPPSAAPGVQIACLAAFSSTSDGLGGCSGLQGPFVGQMVPSTFEAFKEECVAIGTSSIFAQINSTQMSHITPLAFKGLHSNQVTNVPDEAWTGSSKSQLSYLTSDGFSGLRASSLKIVINMYTLDLVNIFTVEQTDDYPLQWAAQFKSFIPAQIAYMTEWDTVSQDLSKATWLKIALLKKGDQQSQAVQGPVFNAETLKMLPFSAYEGLRADHVPLIAAADFKLLNQTHTQYLTNDTFSAVSADQLREISSAAFNFISAFAFSGINPEVVSAITGDQMVYLTSAQIQSLDCKQLQGFTMDQLNQFNQNQQIVFDTVVSIHLSELSPQTYRVMFSTNPDVTQLPLHLSPPPRGIHPSRATRPTTHLPAEDLPDKINL